MFFLLGYLSGIITMTVVVKYLISKKQKYDEQVKKHIEN